MKYLIILTIALAFACGDEPTKKNNAKGTNNQTVSNNTGTTNKGTSGKSTNNKTTQASNNQSASNNTTANTTNNTNKGTTNNTTSPKSKCGNGKIDEGEICDGSEFGGKECKRGKLVCSDDCKTIDESKCDSGSGKITTCEGLIACVEPCRNGSCFKACSARADKASNDRVVTLGTCIKKNKCRAANVTDDACVEKYCATEFADCAAN